MLSVLFWLLLALDAAGIGLWFLLGLAAAGSTGDSAGSVAFALLVLPALPLIAATLVWRRARSRWARTFAFAVVAAPWAVALVSQAWVPWTMARYATDEGELVFFESGPRRDLAMAIRADDAAAVARLAAKLDLGAPGFQGQTFLTLALHRLREAPTQQAVLTALLAAGADPNQPGGGEWPLALALQIADRTGPDPVRALLAAGADPNRRDAFGRPVYFAATGRSAGPVVLAAVIDHGADLAALGPSGDTVLARAVIDGHWASARMLLERGADPRLGRSLDGLTVAQRVAGAAGRAGDDPDYRALRTALQNGAER